MRLRALPVLVVCSAFAPLAGCDRPAAQPAVAADTAPADSAPAAPSWSGSWLPALGDMVMVPADTDNTAIVLYPDAVPAAAGTMRFALFTAAGDTAARAVAVRQSDSLECAGAPVVHLLAGVSQPWTVGLAPQGTVLRGDSVASLARGDSARLVAELARLASAATAREETRFTGLPFSVTDARQYAAGGVRFVTAHLVRKLPQEAAPLEEHLFVVAERIQRDSLTLGYTLRSEGTEETAERYEVLASLALGGTIVAIVARDSSAGTRYDVIERARAGWTLRWSRPLRC